MGGVTTVPQGTRRLVSVTTSLQLSQRRVLFCYAGQEQEQHRWCDGPRAGVDQASMAVGDCRLAGIVDTRRVDVERDLGVGADNRQNHLPTRAVAETA